MWPFTSNTEKSEGTNVQNIEQNTTTTNDPTSNLSASSAQDVLSIDPTTLHPMADVGDKLDYLLLDDDKLSELPGSETALPSRGWTDDLCYGVGTTYVSGGSMVLLILHHLTVHKGLGIGGLWGIREGMNKKLAAPVTRLRINAILNSVTKRGSFIGNSGGVLGLLVVMTFQTLLIISSVGLQHQQFKFG